MKLVFLLTVLGAGLIVWSKSNPLQWLAKIPRRDWIQYGIPTLIGYAIVYVSVSYLNLVFTAYESRVLNLLTDPLTALLFSIFITVLLQASFITEAAVVLAAANMIPLPVAVALVLGGNVGTCITNTVVSFMSFKDKAQFQRAFSASIVHDLFNISMVFFVLPAELTTQFFSRHVLAVANALGSTSSAPTESFGPPLVELGESVPFAILAGLAVVFTLVGVLLIVANLKKLFVDRIADALQDKAFDSTTKSVASGVGFTVLVQSSSLSTSMIVPLVGAGTIKLRKAFDYLLGCNVGTAIVTIVFTLPVILSGSANGTAVALCHLLFNVYGMLIFLTLPFLGSGLCHLAQQISANVHEWPRVKLGLTLGGVYYVAPAVLLLAALSLQ